MNFYSSNSYFSNTEKRLRHLYLTIYYVSVRYASKRRRAPMLIPAPLNGFTYSCFATKMDLHKFSLDTSKSSIADCLTSETARLVVQDFFIYMLESCSWQERALFQQAAEFRRCNVAAIRERRLVNVTTRCDYCASAVKPAWRTESIARILLRCTRCISSRWNRPSLVILCT